MYVPLRFISKLVADRISAIIPGLPTENRILILSPKDQEVTSSGIIIPTSNNNDIPNKGVVISSGIITDEYKTYKDLIKTGNIVTYGMYAGKELDFNPKLFEEAGIDFGKDKHKFSVLSLNEIIFVEPNNN